eukprot:CAMPEP_0179493100 /NCGR_PEP_ID=MMETSP0799-20121207/67230_1 /TAXON_ID=46947 /ORGANISM="Geminigera cryophila, Strain CCMP2564" /LENGTH=125 /DNA_ID=CAMNT_0021310173 /DNA_START=792 /DNA_END=1169 /DNA_ORIENTATION=-
MGLFHLKVAKLEAVSKHIVIHPLATSGSHNGFAAAPRELAAAWSQQPVEICQTFRPRQVVQHTHPLVFDIRVPQQCMHTRSHILILVRHCPRQAQNVLQLPEKNPVPAHQVTAVQEKDKAGRSAT